MHPLVARALKSSLALLFFFLAGLGTSAKEKAPDWLAGLTGLKSLQPGAEDNAVVLLDEGVLNVSPEGVSTTRVRWAVRIVNREGRKYARAHAHYDQSYEKVKSLKAWSIRPDNQVIAYGKDRIADLAVYGGALELYGDARAQIIDATEDASAGTIFGYEKIIEERVISPERWWFFQDDLPVERSSFTVTLPPGWEARARLSNAPGLTPQVSGATSTWTLSQLVNTKEEPLSPDQREVKPWMVVQLVPPSIGKANLTSPIFESWQQMAAYYTPKYEAQSLVDPSIKAKATALTAKASGAWEQIKCLCRYAQQVNYISINLDSSKGGGCLPREASRVLRCNYGDCKDKSTLLRALLAGIGVSSYPVIVYSGDSHWVQEDWTSPAQFNHCILAIPVDDAVVAPAVAVHPTLGRLLFFDPTNAFIAPGHLPAEDAETPGLILDRRTERLFRLPGPIPAQNRCERLVTAKLLNDGKVTGRIQETFTDQYSASVRAEYRSASPSDYQRLIEHWLANTLPAPRAKILETEDNFDDARFSFSVDFEADNYGKLMLDRLLVFKPVLVTRRNNIPLRKGVRVHPVVLSANSFSERTEIELPEGFRVDEKLSPVDLKTSFGHYRAKATVEAGKLVFERSLDLSSVQIPAAEYESVRSFFEKILQSEQTPVVLARL